MGSPIVRKDGREQLVPLEQLPGEPLDVPKIQNLLGDLEFEDGSNPTVTLTQLVAGSLPGEARVSGIRNQGDGLLSTPQSDTVRCEAGSLAIMVERLAGGVAVEHVVSWPQQDIVVAGFADPVAYWVIEDIGFTGTGTLVEMSTTPPAWLLRASPWLFLGVSFHEAGSVIETLSDPDVVNDQGFLVDDTIELISGVTRKAGIAFEVAGTLGIGHTDIVLFGPGLNFHTSFIDSNNKTFPGHSPMLSNTIAGDGSLFNTGVADAPATYNNAGVETALVSSEAAVHQVFIDARGKHFIQLGTTAYPSYEDAEASVLNERIQNPAWELLFQFGSPLGFIVIKAGATQWLLNEARFLEESITGGVAAGGVATNFLALTDTPFDYVGAAGQVVKVSTLEDGVEYGKVRAQIMISPTDINVDASGGAVFDVGMPAHINAAVFHLENVHLEVKAAPGADTEVDVRIGGSSVFGGTRPEILSGQLIGELAAVTEEHFEGDRIRIDVLSGDDAWEHMTATLEGWSEPE